MFNRITQLTAATCLALGIASAPAQAGDEAGSDVFTTDRQVVWENFFGTSFPEDGGFLFFDEMVVETGPTSATDGNGSTMELEVVDVKHYDPRTAATSGLFEIDAIRFILENQLEYSLITARATVGASEGLVLISSFGGFILADSDDWIGFGWTQAALLPVDTQGFAAAPDPCGEWSLPPDHTWPLPAQGDTWCDSFNTIPCDLQDPPDSLNVVNLDCFDDALKEWKKSISEAQRQHEQDVRAARSALETCLTNAGSSHTECIDQANETYDAEMARIARQKLVLGGGVILVGLFTSGTGSIILGGGAMAAMAQLDQQERDAAAEKLAAIRDCDQDHEDAKDGCEAEFDAKACTADDNAEAAVRDADDAFLAALEDCCEPCRKSDEDVQELDARPVGDGGVQTGSGSIGG